MTILCNATPCPVILSSCCVFYEGTSLIYSGINMNDSLETVIQKFDQLIHNKGIVESDPVFSQWLSTTPPAYPSDIPIIGTGDKSSTIDAGTFKDISIGDDYLYICTQTGTAGNAIWKKTVLFNT